MEILLEDLAEAILIAAEPWFNGTGDANKLLEQSLSELVTVCYERGPILRAVAEASTNDERLEQAWAGFLKQFDDVVSEQIEKHQRAGLVSEFEARPVAMALNRLDVSMLIDAFGHHPRSNPEPLQQALIRIWVSTLYQSTYLPDPPNDS